MKSRFRSVPNVRGRSGLFRSDAFYFGARQNGGQASMGKPPRARVAYWNTQAVLAAFPTESFAKSRRARRLERALNCRHLWLFPQAEIANPLQIAPCFRVWVALRRVIERVRRRERTISARPAAAPSKRSASGSFARPSPNQFLNWVMLGLREFRACACIWHMRASVSPNSFAISPSFLSLK